MMLKFLPLVWAGLWRKPLRTTFTVLSLVTAFALFGMLQGINAGFDLLTSTSRMQNLFVNSRFGAPMPIAYRDQIAQLPGIRSITAQTFINGYLGDPKTQFFVGASDDGFFDYFAEFNTTKQQIAEMRGSRTAFITSKNNAERLKIKVGDHLTMVSNGIAKRDGSKNWEFDLVAIVDRDDIPNVAGISVGNFEYVNEERAAGKDMVNQFLIVLSEPERAVETAKAIDAMFLNSAAPTRTSVELLVRQAGQADNNIGFMVNAIVLAALFALLLLTSNVMMQSFRERTTEFGTLKAVGFPDSAVLMVVLGESLLQCLGGAAIGLVIARVAVPYVKKAIPGPTGLMYVPMTLIITGLGVAAAVALVSAALPAWRANRMQIVDALAGR